MHRMPGPAMHAQPQERGKMACQGTEGTLACRTGTHTRTHAHTYKYEEGENEKSLAATEARMETR